MNMLEAHIKVLSDKLQQAIKRSALQKKENEVLAREVIELKAKEENYKSIISSLSEKVNILKAASGNMTEVDQKEFEKRIDRYIREIDKCIGALSE